MEKILIGEGMNDETIIAYNIVKLMFFVFLKRIVCAVGYSGVSVKPEKVSLHFSVGDETTFADKSRNRVQIVEAGQPLSGADILKACAGVLKEKDIVVEVDLGLGSAESVVWTCDLSKDYVAINADYTT